MQGVVSSVEGEDEIVTEADGDEVINEGVNDFLGDAVGEGPHVSASSRRDPSG